MTHHQTAAPHAANRFTRQARHATALAVLALLAGCELDDEVAAEPPPAPPVLTAQPQDTEVGEGAAATFELAATSSTGALSVQWWRGSGTAASPVAGATGTAFTTAATTLQDDGALFSARVANAAGEVGTREASLRVTERTWAASPLPPSGAAGDQPAAAGNGQAALVVDSQGHTHALVLQNEGDAVALWAVRKTAGSEHFTAWQRVDVALDPTLANRRWLSLTADATGRVLALWLESLGDTVPRIRAALYQPGSGAAPGAWSSPVDVSHDGARVTEDPPVAAAGDGGFEIVWRASPVDETRLRQPFGRRLAAGGAQPVLEPVQRLATHDEWVLSTALAGDGQGRVALAWSVVAGGEMQTFMRHRLPGGNWSEPVEADDLPDRPAQLAHLQMNAAGQGVLVMGSSETRVYARRFSLAQGALQWQEGARYVANRSDAQADPTAAAVDAAGRVHIVAVHGNGYRLSRWRFDGNDWQPLEALRDLTGSTTELPVLRFPRVGVDAAGNATVTWQENGGNGWQLLAQRHHQALAGWRALATLPLDAALWAEHASVVHPDGSASVLAGLIQGSVALRAWRFR